ncbi:MAG: hypothetical protein HKO02_07870 [Hyphomonadaceae bacterium]|nr:hypothetical protein [Hyphomonadaceae bacterium]
MAGPIRRQSRKMPSVKKHGLSAFLVLLIFGVAAFAVVNFQESDETQNAVTGPEITLPKQIAPDPGPAETALPDLLAADNIPLDENPTENIALIGAPDTTAPITGPRPPDTGSEPAPGSKTILIDGSPIQDSGASLNTSAPLTRAPIQGLSRTSPFGQVPHPATDGRTAYKSYAKPFTPASGKSHIALVVGGLGVNSIVTRRAISELPGEVTLSFAADTPDLQTWVNQARARGHEVMIEVPMESTNFDPLEPGAVYTLMSSGPDSENIRNLDYLLSRAEGYFAVTNYGGDKLIKSEKTLTSILTHMGDAGLGFLYDGIASGSRVDTLGNAVGLKTVSAQSLLDADIQNRSTVRSKISTLRDGTSVKVPIGMGFSYGSTIDGIKDWILNKPANIELAPASFAMIQNK